MGLFDLIPYIGMAVNAFGEVGGDVAPTMIEWGASAGSTVAGFALARVVLKLPIWDEIVERTATKWDDYALKAARKVLVVLAVKPSKKRSSLSGKV